MNIVLAIVIAVAVIVLQNYLSKLKNWLFGGILPIFLILFTIFNFYYLEPVFKFRALVPYAILLLILIVIWSNGREFEKKQSED